MLPKSTPVALLGETPSRATGSPILGDFGMYSPPQLGSYQPRAVPRRGQRLEYVTEEGARRV